MLATSSRTLSLATRTLASARHMTLSAVRLSQGPPSVSLAAPLRPHPALGVLSRAGGLQELPACKKLTR